MSTYTDLIDDIEPTSSDEAVITSVLNKNRIVKRKKVRNLAVSVFLITIFAAMTITVGAVNDWDYTAVLQRIFNDNPVVAVSMENDKDYRVINNTYDGITFELNGLYADDESLFLIVEITSETPRFLEPLRVTGGSALRALLLAPNSPESDRLYTNWPDRPGFTTSDFHYYVIDETRMIAVIYFGESRPYQVPAGITSYVHPFHEAAASNREFVLLFGDIMLPDGDDYSGLYLRGGSAELRFTVDAIDTQNIILINSDLPPMNNAILNELRITPFSMTIRFDGLSVIVGEYVVFLMKDGEAKPLHTLSAGFSKGYFSDNENHTWIATFHHDNLLDLDEVAAVIFNGVEIPVIR